MDNHSAHTHAASQEEEHTDHSEPTSLRHRQRSTALFPLNPEHLGHRKQLILSLPLETRWLTLRLRQYQGFWQGEGVLPAVFALQEHLQPHPTDVFLASYPKCGTTWLKALTYATMTRCMYPLASHPLLSTHPHDCVPFLELFLTRGDDITRVKALPCPRIFALHLPYSMLPEYVKSSNCRIVYICREPKDALVSAWCFSKKNAADMGISDPFPIALAVELFCEGRTLAGPMWDHVLEYWKESLRRPEKVLFLKYEEMLAEPVINLKRLAEFVGCAFSEAEEKGGVVEEILELCSLKTMKNLEVNKNTRGASGVKNDGFFRKGVAGDWRNHMTPEMARRVDEIFQEKLQGSGLDLAN